MTITLSPEQIGPTESVTITKSAPNDAVWGLFLGESLDGSGAASDLGPNLAWEDLAPCSDTVLTIRLYEPGQDVTELSWATSYAATASTTFLANPDATECVPVFDDETLNIPSTATAGAPYTGYVHAIGENVTYEISSGALPDGLTFDAEHQTVAGVPTTPGLSTFTFHATNSFGSVDHTFSIRVMSDGTFGLTEGVGGVISETRIQFAFANLKAGSAWSAVVRSTPVTVASGTVNGTGSISGLVALPTGLDSAWHSVTLSFVKMDGTPDTRQTWFRLDASGTIVEVSQTAPASSLAHTGVNGFATALAAGALLIIGFSVIARRRATHR
ncbi:MAG TPA: putative Ig domain-containing protein [Microbacteriaceae bacterium]|nr:putative Ig domain-containing protein [Microbacteriaceae bacterium]